MIWMSLRQYRENRTYKFLERNFRTVSVSSEQTAVKAELGLHCLPFNKQMEHITIFNNLILPFGKINLLNIVIYGKFDLIVALIFRTVRII